MVAAISRVIVIGATGNIGRPIVSSLLEAGFTVSALTRPTSTSPLPSGVTAIKAEYSAEALLAAFQGQDAVVCAIATSNLPDQQRIVEAAVAAGVKRFIPSEFGYDTSEDKLMEFSPCVGMKRDVVKQLQAKEGTGMSWTAVVCGLWLEWVCGEQEWPWWSIPNKTFTRFDDGEAPFEVSSLSQVGKAIAALLLPQNLEATKNTYIFIHSYTLTQNRLLQIFEKATGDKFIVTPNKVKDICAAGQEIFYRSLNSGKTLEELGHVPEFQGAIVYMISSGCFGNGGFNQFPEKAKMWMDELGLKEEDAEDNVIAAVRELQVHA